MARVEVDEADLLAASHLTQTVQGILAHPQARSMLLQAQKLVKPDAVIPEIDSAAPLKSELSAIREEMAAERKARADEKAADAADREAKKFERTWNSRKASLANAGYTTEGIAKIEALAQERGIPDLEAAAALFDRLNPPPPPVMGTSFSPLDSYNNPSQENGLMKRLMETHGKEDGPLNGLISEAIQDFRNGGRR